MRFLIIRHGDPDYAHDSLTPKGFREAEALAVRLKKEGVNKIYVSPLGRAAATAAPTAAALKLTPEVLPWLTEFPVPLKADGVNPNPQGHCPWNIFPELWSGEACALSNESWRSFSLYKDCGIAEYFDNISAQLDALMAKHGYLRNGQYYNILPGFEHSTETVALFCHHGVGCALLAHLCSISLPLFWHSFFLTTSSVTQILMEKHHSDNKTAVARIISLADTSHLYAAGEPVSSSGLHSPIE